MNPQELLEAVARNNTRAVDRTRWRLRWMFANVIPTGTEFTTFFEIPQAANLFRLEYVLLFWPVTVAFRPLFVEVNDERGQKNVHMDARNVATSLGMNVALFTTPGTDPNSTLAGDQSQYLGTTCINLEFPGRSSIGVTIRGATAAPNPASVSILVTGHAKQRP